MSLQIGRQKVCDEIGYQIQFFKFLDKRRLSTIGKYTEISLRSRIRHEQSSYIEIEFQLTSKLTILPLCGRIS